MTDGVNPLTQGAPGTQVHNEPGPPGVSASFHPPGPLPPLNTSAIPGAGSLPPLPTGIGSPVSAGGTVRRAAPEPNKRALYVGGLDPRVQDEVLKQIFETVGHVQSVKIIPDKNQKYDGTQRPDLYTVSQTPLLLNMTYQSKGFNYGFVEYDDPADADRAMATLNGRRVHGSEIRVNWAYQSNSSAKEDTTNHHHIFVGDLSNEVNDDVLHQAFSAFGAVSEARVMWDMKTGRSRGYGFVAFRDQNEAGKAIAAMNGEWLGSRAIRCNWANQKGQPSMSQQQAMAQMGMTPTTPFGHHQYPTNGPQSYDMIVSQTPGWQTTCYVGNLTPYTTSSDLVPLFQNFGYVVESRFQSDRGFAFIKMDTHENAANAICQLSGYQVNGRPLKCSWGKDRPPTGQFDGYSPQAQTPGFPPNPGSYQFPQYGAPPAAMSPQGYSPQYGPPPHAPYSMPGSAGGYGRGGHSSGPPYSAGGYGYGGYSA